MSKKDLKEYLQQLNKKQLQEQITDLYTRFKDVKEFYDFAFNPQENKLLEECKFKISKEYFPLSGRKAKMRRSVAQKFIRHFKKLGVEPNLIADVMLYQIEIAITYTSEKYIKQEAFYKSMLKSFAEAVTYINENAVRNDFNERLIRIADDVTEQNWIGWRGFEKLIK
ncbi:hypothetical protein BZG01_14925 [Labilibaculum manganireducens]|uniref:Uncharacterized protein n=1 Tax=Labilibaculum manganireducens TaxID=1940525 RepID=A0A2N3I192_9BACT|nr:DUF6155 family protein [Labilibaculum manganireducens]PKQ64079.1 hypothetical protein BZG01_14925 [Labilibaculum manganireducens]